MRAAKYRFPFRLLKSNRSVRNLWFGETISYFGDNFYNIAIMWFVYSKTGSGLETGLILVSSFLPQVIVGPFLGVLADRVNRKRMMQLSSLIQFIITGTLSVLMWVGIVRLWQIYIFTILLSIAQLVYSPARAGLFPDLVDNAELMSGNAMFSTSQQLARLVGSAAGGSVIALTGSSTAVGFDALTFLMSALFIHRVKYNIRTLSLHNKGKNTVLSDMHIGWSWLFSHKGLLILIIIGTVSNIALGPTNVLAPMLIKDVLHAGPSALGAFDACIGLGIVLGGILIGTVSSHKVGILFTMGIGLQGVSLALVSISHSVLLAYTGNFILGLAIVMANLPTSTMFQVLVPADMRGRVGAISGMLSSIAIPITYGGVGLFGDFFGARWSYGIGAILMGCCVLIGVSAPRLRQLSSQSPANESNVTETVNG